MSDTPSNGPKRAKAAAGKAKKELEERLEALRAEMDEIMSSLGQKAEKRVSEATDILSNSTVDEIAAELREILDEIRHQAGVAEKKVVETARDNPVQTLLVAFGVGFLASLFLRR